MKIIFYKALLKQRRGLTPNERILYSFLISKTLTRLEMVFNDDGTLNFDLVKEYCEEEEYYPMNKMSHGKMATELHITRQSIVSMMKDLEKKGFIVNTGDERYLCIPDEIPKGGFFRLEKVGKLKGELLIFYSYLLSRSREPDHTIDTYNYKLAELYGAKENAIKMLLKKLRQMGYVTRGVDNTLFVMV